MIIAKKNWPVLLSFFLIFFGLVSCNDPNEVDVSSRSKGKGKTQTTSTTTTTTTTTESSPTQTATVASLIYEEKVEGSTPFSTANDWDVGDWDYALQFVSDPVFQGSKCARFEIREDQPLVANGKRSEITIVKGADGEISKNTWYSFAVYFPTVGYEFDHEREVINQWYQNGSPATSLRTDEDRILLETGNTMDTRVRIDLGPIVKDKWHEVVMHFIHSYGSDGLIELWLDGEKKVTKYGGNMYDDILPKWKIGLYKSAFKDGTSDVYKRIIYFDNVRVGDQNNSYETMKPNN
jgi:hypothetical protein